MKFVIIGCGLIAGSHANAIRNCKGAELAAVCGRRKEPVFKFAKEQGCEEYTDVETMLDEIRPDAAIICTPTYLHADHVEQCAKRNIHVLCEKPLAKTPAECRRILDAAKKGRIIFMTAQVVRFWAGYVEIKSMLQKGQAGEIHMMHLRRVSHRSGKYSQWIFDPLLGGGAMGDMLVHDVDYLRYAIGPFQSVFANASKDETGCYNNVMANIIHKNGVHSLAEVSFTQQTGYPFSFSVDIAGSEATVEYQYASGGSTLVNPSGGTCAVSTCNMSIWKRREGFQTVPIQQYDAYERQFQYFADCVEKGCQPEAVTPEESYEVICMMDAIRRSADSNEVVHL